MQKKTIGEKVSGKGGSFGCIWCVTLCIKHWKNATVVGIPEVPQSAEGKVLPATWIDVGSPGNIYMTYFQL